MSDENTTITPNDTATPEAAATTTPQAAPEVDISPEAAGTDNLTDAQLYAMEQNGGKLPDRLQNDTGETDTPETETPDKDAAKNAAETDDESAPDNRDTDLAAEETDATEAEDTPFEFTENADAETIVKEANEFLASFEDSPEIQKMKQAFQTMHSQITNRDNQLSEITALGEIENIKKVQTALDALATRYRQEDDGSFVPDTTDVREVLREANPQGYEQMFYDELSQPSAKYHGQTKMEETLFDAFGFSDEKARHGLMTYLTTGGQTMIPPYNPPGVDDSVSEAFWKSVDRPAIEATLEEAHDILSDEYSDAAEKAGAKQQISIINQRLAQVQQGLNADKKALQEREQFKANQEQALNIEAYKQYQATTVALEKEMSERMAKSLQTTFGEGSGAQLHALGLLQIAKNAVSDDLILSANARETLKNAGIDMDYHKAGQSFDNLYKLQNKVVRQETAGANERAIEVTRREIANTLREIKAQETEFIGKALKVSASGAGAALKAKANTASPQKSPFKPKQSAVDSTPKNAEASGYQGMTDAEIYRYEQGKAMLAGGK